MKKHNILFLLVVLLLIFSSCNAPSFSRSDDFSSAAPSAPPTESTPTPAPQKTKISLTPPIPLEEDSRYLFEREPYDADFYGFSKDGKYFVASFEKEGVHQKEGSYLFFVGRELKAHEQEKLDLNDQTMVLLRQNQVCNVYEIYSLHHLEDDPTYGTLALRRERKTTVGSYTYDVTYITLLHYVKQPLEDYPLIPPDPVIPNPQRPLTEWLEWLTTQDMGESGIYPAISGSLYTGCDYDGTEGPMTASPWELWPYVPGDEHSVSENTHFHLLLRLSKTEIDAYTDINTAKYPYVWKNYYRPMNATEDYKMVEGTPWDTSSIGEDKIYRFNLMDYGMEKPEIGESYHMIFFILDKSTGQVVAWTDLVVDWTDSSEAYYQDALKHGVINTSEQ